jgi:hypothetical protein
MQTQYGNFLYQVEAKQFPQQMNPMAGAPTKPMKNGQQHNK